MNKENRKFVVKAAFVFSAGSIIAVTFLTALAMDAPLWIAGAMSAFGLIIITVFLALINRLLRME